MAKKSNEDIIKENIERLLDYSVNKLSADEFDTDFKRNILLNFYDLCSPAEGFHIDNYDIYDVLNCLFTAAVNLKRCTEADKTRFENKMLGMLMPLPSAVVECFDNIATYEDSMAASRWLRQFEENALYLRRRDLDKNIKWEYQSSRGNIVVTINLAKPEKTAEEIEKAKEAVTGFPKCPLCAENVGFWGNAAMASRQNLRTIPFQLNGEPWFLQFSPYEYFDEHLIAVSSVHRPMKIDGDAARRLLDFVDLFPEYFIGSNAALPIVGGSILAHDHYQGGAKVLPIFSRPARKRYLTQEFPLVDIDIVDWYNSVLRFSSSNREQLTEAVIKFGLAWENYSDISANILCRTNTQHNTVNPIAYLNDDGNYTILLILRNNRTDKTHPYGIFHPTEDMFNIKQESIGLIEAMGVFILPGRLASEAEKIKNILTGIEPLNFAALAEDKNPLHKHLGMIAQLAADYGTKLKDAKAGEAITDYINTTCEKILDCTAVFKNDEMGQAAFTRFVENLI